MRGGMAAGSGPAERGGLEAAVRGRLRGLKERWARGLRERAEAASQPGPAGGEGEAEEASALQALPVSSDPPPSPPPRRYPRGCRAPSPPGGSAAGLGAFRSTCS